MKLEFRDGDHEVPDYLADMMAGLDTYRMTVDEAIAEANEMALKRHLDRTMDDIINTHMKNLDMLR